MAMSPPPLLLLPLSLTLSSPPPLLLLLPRPLPLLMSMPTCSLFMFSVYMFVICTRSLFTTLSRLPARDNPVTLDIVSPQLASPRTSGGSRSL
ncbi:hypothetical protein B484DRAFT_454217 [Ochromonadaceae sp. CCMP2298]|nr:hypothetical protein B484DRAFT_454217 [Ochromonadaceae sp. CCMP2298]